MVKRREMGGFGGGWLEHPKWWLGSRWLGLALGVPSCPEPPGAPWGGTEAEPGRCQGRHFDHAGAPEVCAKFMISSVVEAGAPTMPQTQAKLEK